MAHMNREMFMGFIVARNATDHMAPEFVFRVPGWSSSSGGSKIIELVADGTVVKQGDLIARFEFGAIQAQNYINERIAATEAALQQSTIYASQVVEVLELDLRRAKMAQETARLNEQRAPALSKIQGEVLALQHRLAVFEVEAAEKRLASTRVTQAAAREHARQARDAALSMRERYEFYLERFTVRAAHDGVVRHAYNARERRTFRKGDNVQSGMRIVSVAKNDALSAVFFVSEVAIASVHKGDRVRVQLPTSTEHLIGEVEELDFFPQELGFLLENETLPNAREKAVRVKASLSSTASTASLAAGTEVRVSLSASEPPR
jgi:multidrug resistance efflux pump